MPNRPRTHFLFFLLIVFAIFTSIATIIMIQDYVLSELSGRGGRRTPHYFRHFLGWNSWVLTVPFAWWLVKKHIIERVPYWKLLLYFFGITLLVIVYKAFALEALSYFSSELKRWRDYSYLREVFFSVISPRSFMETIIFWFILAFAYALQYSQLLKDKEIRSTQLESQLAHAQLDALKMQLQPHFLFNTLHSISTLLREKTGEGQLHQNMKDADNMIFHLGEMFRHTLRTANRHTVPLRDELRFLDHYLSIEKMRFSDKLSIEKHIAPGVEAVEVPPYLLQPMVENAIRHGISKEPHPGTVRIEIQRKNDHIQFIVEDTGTCSAQDLASIQTHGVGLLNTQKRLAYLYGNAYEFELKKRPTRNTQVRIVIPSQIKKNLEPLEDEDV